MTTFTYEGRLGYINKYHITNVYIRHGHRIYYGRDKIEYDTWIDFKYPFIHFKPKRGSSIWIPTTVFVILNNGQYLPLNFDSYKQADEWRNKFITKLVGKDEFDSIKPW